MMTVELTQLPLIHKVQIARLPERYGISFLELCDRFSQLEIQPEEIDGSLCIDSWQLSRLEDLHASLQGSRASSLATYDSGETFLYRCSRCGDLWLVDTPLHANRDPLRLCDGEKGDIAFHVGGFEFIASGPYEEIVSWAQSIMLGLDDPMKGI